MIGAIPLFPYVLIRLDSENFSFDVYFQSTSIYAHQNIKCDTTDHIGLRTIKDWIFQQTVYVSFALTGDILTFLSMNST